MEIKFLGTGGAFDYKKGTSSAVVTHGDKKMLIDCGSSVFGSLRDHDLIDKIDHILITHMHGDHVGCLFQLIYFNHYVLSKETDFLYPTESMRDSIVNFLNAQSVNQNYYTLTNISEVKDLDFIDTTGMHAPNMLNFAYYFKDGNDLIFYSGDLSNIQTTLDFITGRDEKVKIFQDINSKDGASHVFYQEAQAKLKGYEVYGYHCDKATMPSDCTLPLVEDYPDLNY